MWTVQEPAFLRWFTQRYPISTCCFCGHKEAKLSLYVQTDQRQTSLRRNSQQTGFLILIQSFINPLETYSLKTVSIQESLTNLNLSRCIWFEKRIIFNFFCRNKIFLIINTCYPKHSRFSVKGLSYVLWDILLATIKAATFRRHKKRRKICSLQL